MLVVSLAVAGCGSTVLQHTSATGAPVATGGVAAPGTVPGATGELGGAEVPGAEVPGLEVPGAELGTEGTSGGGTSVANPTGTAAASGTSSAPGTSGAPASAAKSGPLKVGIATTNLAAIAAVFGKDNVDTKKEPKKFVDNLNKRGGIGGREIVPTWFEADSADSSSTNGQRACAAFTQDTKVEVVINAGMFGGDVLPACLRAAGIAIIDVNWAFPDRVVARQYPNWIVPPAMRVDRSVGSEIEQAASRGILKRGDNLGILVEGCPWGQRVVDGTVKPLAAKYGLKLTQGTFKCIDNIVSDLGPVSNDIQRETLRFNQAERVTHVLVISAAEAFVYASFTDNASSQKYYPKYLISSLAYPYQNSREGAVISISPDALPNTYGFGTIPALDIGSDKPVNAAQAAAQKRCTDVDPTKYDANTLKSAERPFRWATFYSLCETFMSLKAVLEINGNRTAYPDVAAGWRAMLSKGAGSSMFVGGRYGGGESDRTDGASYVRPFVWDADTENFRYTGSAVRVP